MTMRLSSQRRGDRASDSLRSWNYAERCGMRIPLHAEDAWHLDDLPEPYWRGRITAIECGPLPPTG